MTPVLRARVYTPETPTPITMKTCEGCTLSLDDLGWLHVVYDGESYRRMYPPGRIVSVEKAI